MAERHGGVTADDNLGLTCWRCNRHKGTDLTSFDPETGTLCRLFHPRTQQWPDHFALREAVIVGLTPEGRTTARLLQMNAAERIQEREQMQEHGHYPRSVSPE